MRPPALARPRKNELKIDVALLGRHAGPGIDHVDHRLAPARRTARAATEMVPPRGGELDRVADQVVDDRAQLLRVGLDAWPSRASSTSALALGAHRELVRARRLAHQRVQRDRAQLERRRGVQRALVVEQLLDQALQLDAVVPHDRHHLALRRRERPADLVVQQLGALAQRGQRRLQLVRQVAQEAVLLRLELVQPAAQPVEALAQRTAGPPGRAP